MKCKKIRYIWMTLIIVIVAICAVAYCPHKVTYTKIVKEPTCVEVGQLDIICKRCDTVLESNTLEKIDHTFGDYEVTIKPNALGPGLEVRTCSFCLKEETREYFCVHEINSEEEWIYAKYATPLESGERYKHCLHCGTEMTESYNMSMANNSIYITGTNINNGFVISSFTQSAVDTYDIVYTEQSEIGSNNPFVLGHNYGSLGILFQTKVGEYIYLYINGVIEVYEVIVSEYGMQNSTKSDIIGQTTGTSIWHNYGCKTLHMYTCYGNNKNGRWMVLAKKIL